MMRNIRRSPVDLLQDDWTFRPSRAALHIRALRLRHRFKARLPAPAYHVVRWPEPSSRWNLLFLFLPDGMVGASQHEILRRVRQLSGRLLVVFAAPFGAMMPAELDVADAIVHKAIEGFDFSGYAIGLTLLARHSPGADVYVQNDSVLGPFADIDALVNSARWDLTGFMASAAVENHLSSFAFILKAATPERVATLSDVFSRRWCYDDFESVVLSQETRFARIAHRSMSVGAFHYMPIRPAARSWRQRLGLYPKSAVSEGPSLDLSGDATLGSPIALLDRGFPFLKRSLFGKFQEVADGGHLHESLSGLRWPQDAI